MTTSRLASILLVVVIGLALARCAGERPVVPASTPTMGSSTTARIVATTPIATPTPPPVPTPAMTVTERRSFESFLLDLDSALASGSVAPLADRLMGTPYVCTPDDVPVKLGGPACTTVGETFDAIPIGRWKSEGGLVPVDSIRTQLATVAVTLKPGESDAYGSGRLRVYAFDATRLQAVITALVACPPNFNCAGPLRIAFVFSFQQPDGDWRISAVTTAYVFADDFLIPSADGRQVLPGWQRL